MGIRILFPSNEQVVDTEGEGELVSKNLLNICRIKTSFQINITNAQIYIFEIIIFFIKIIIYRTMFSRPN